MSSDAVFRWKIDNLKESCEMRTELYSNTFSLKTDPTAKFSLWLNGSRAYSAFSTTSTLPSYFYPWMGVIAKNVSTVKDVELLINFWLENEEGTKFREIERKYKFKKDNEETYFTFVGPDNDCKIFKDIYNSGKSLTLCCKIKNLTIQLPMTLGQKMWKLYEDGEDTDATIVVGDRKFQIHRAALSASSEHFKKMFSSKCKEGLTKTVEIKNVTVEAIEAFIKWIYLNQIEDKSVIEELFKLAEKYMVEDLKEQCASLLLQDLSKINAARRLILAITYKQDDLKERVLAFINKMKLEETLEIYQSDEWFDYLNQQRSLNK